MESTRRAWLALLLLAAGCGRSTTIEEPERPAPMPKRRPEAGAPVAPKPASRPAGS